MSRLRNILYNSLARNTLKLSSSNIVMYLLPLIVTPILSRVYTQEDYGEWGVFSSTFLIINSLLFLSYENTLVKAKDEREIPSLCIVCVSVAACIIGLSLLIFTVGGRTGVSYFTGFPSVTLLFVALLFSAFNQLSYNLSNRYERYTLMSFANIIQGFSQAAFRLALGFIKGCNGLIVGNLLSIMLSLLFYVSMLYRKLRDSFRTYRPNLTAVRQLARKYVNFPLYDAPSVILETAIFNLALIILSFFFSKSDIGCYSMIFQFIVLPVSLIGSAMSKVYYKEISVAQQFDDISAITRKVTTATLVLSVLPITFIVLGGDYLITIYLGSKWSVAGDIALCMSIMSVPIILSETLLPLFRRMDRQKTRLLYDLLCFGLGIGGLLTCCHLTSNLYEVLVVYAVCYSVARFLMFFNIMHMAKVRLPFRVMCMAYPYFALLYLIAFIRIAHLITQ